MKIQVYKTSSFLQMLVTLLGFIFFESLQLEAISFASLCYVLELHEIFEMLGFVALTSNDATTAFTGSCEQVASLYKSMF